jgi:hypothetical protein
MNKSFNEIFDIKNIDNLLKMNYLKVTVSDDAIVYIKNLLSPFYDLIKNYPHVALEGEPDYDDEKHKSYKKTIKEIHAIIFKYFSSEMGAFIWRGYLRHRNVCEIIEYLFLEFIEPTIPTDQFFQLEEMIDIEKIKNSIESDYELKAFIAKLQMTQ